MQSVIFHVIRRGDGDRWILAENGKSLAEFTTTPDAVREGRVMTHGCERHGQHAQLVVHMPDGSTETEYTFGSDPL